MSGLRNLKTSNHDYLCLSCFNARSICNKTLQITELLLEQDIDIMCLTETWLKKSSNATILELSEMGYGIIHTPRFTKGGGTAILFKDSFIMKRQKTTNYVTFEVTESIFMVPTTNKHIRLSSVYRTCTNNNSNENICKFFNEFEEYLTVISQKPGLPIVCGDLNLHLECQNSTTLEFIGLINGLGYIQHVDVPTHIGNGTLDVVITKDSEIDSDKSVVIKDLSVNCETGTTSDHYLIKFSVPFATLSSKSNWILKEKRNFCEINLDNLQNDIANSIVCDAESFINIDNAVELYNDQLKDILDRHAPVKKIYVKTNKCKWWNNLCQQSRRERRRAERNFKKHRSHHARINYRNKCLQAQTVMNDARQTFFKNKLLAAKGNNKATFSIINYLLSSTKSSVLPSNKNDVLTAENFADFFQNKVKRIHNDLAKLNLLNSPSRPDSCISTAPKFCNFKTISSADLKNMILSMSSSSCILDPLPTWLLKQVIDLLMPIITFIVNQSISTGYFPMKLKNAVIIPSLKKKNLDQDDLSNYRPISNLSFLSKIIERCVGDQIYTHLIEHNLLCMYQSGYRKFHSCETVITKVCNDLVTVTNDNKLHHCLIMLLDMSSAFDTLQHDSLLQSIHDDFGIDSIAFQWLHSYLSDRHSCVLVNKTKSSCFKFEIGVPQGSVLGPLLFILFTNNLQSIAKKHDFLFHSYADDSQFYLRFSPNPANKATHYIAKKVQKCLIDIESWMTKRYLKMNMSKTEFLEICPYQHRNCIKQFSEFTVNAINIKSSKNVKCLGFYYDEKLSFERNINEIIKICNFRLSNLYRIGFNLPKDLKLQLVQSYIFSCLDYCNAVYYGLNNQLMNKLQSIQNKCAKYVLNVNNFDNAKSMCKELHFLPIYYRINYKIALMVYKCLNNQAPEYLKNLISIKKINQSHNLRLEYQLSLLATPHTFPKFKKCQLAFTYAAPKVWNSLPLQIRSIKSLNIFKQKLKTYFFKLAYNT